MLQRDFRHKVKEKMAEPANWKLTAAQVCPLARAEVIDPEELFQNEPIGEICNDEVMDIALSKEKQVVHRGRRGQVGPHQCHDDVRFIKYIRTDHDGVRTVRVGR